MRWRPIPGWEGFYEVSDTGQVKSLTRSVPGRPGVLINRRERLLTPHLRRDGYLIYALCRDNRKRTIAAHRLVLLAFIGPCPDGLEACHNDGDKMNNGPSNLRWDTHSANTYDKVKHGAHPMARRTVCANGHAYDAVNTYTSPNGGRHCRICRLDAKRRYNRRLAA